MFKINEVTIENDVLNANVTITMSDKTELVVNVPVKPNTKEDVLAAIQYRTKLEQAKYDAAPKLTAIKDELDIIYTGKTQTVVK